MEFEEIYNSYENSDLEARNELQDLMSKSSGDCTVKSFTIRWSWNKLNAFINQTYGNNRNSECLDDCSPNGTTNQVTTFKNDKGNEEMKPVDVLCGICKKSLFNEESIINTSWRHIYHPDWLIKHWREYLSKWQYPRNWPRRGWK